MWVRVGLGDGVSDCACVSNSFNPMSGVGISRRL